MRSGSFRWVKWIEKFVDFLVDNQIRYRRVAWSIEFLVSHWRRIHSEYWAKLLIEKFCLRDRACKELSVLSQWCHSHRILLQGLDIAPEGMYVAGLQVIWEDVVYVVTVGCSQYYPGIVLVFVIMRPVYVVPSAFGLLLDSPFLATHAFFFCGQSGNIVSRAGSLKRYWVLHVFHVVFRSFQFSLRFWSSNLLMNSVVNAVALSSSFPQSALFQMGPSVKPSCWCVPLVPPEWCHHGAIFQVSSWGFSPVRVQLN